MRRLIMNPRIMDEENGRDACRRRGAPALRTSALTESMRLPLAVAVLILPSGPPRRRFLDRSFD